MEDYLQPDIYNSYYWSPDQLSNWNNAVSRDCDWSIYPVFQGQETSYSQSPPFNGLNGPSVGSEKSVESNTGPVRLALQAQEQHRFRGRHTSSSVTSDYGCATSLISSRLGTPSLTDASTIVPHCSPSVLEEPAEGPWSQSPCSIRFNEAVRTPTCQSPINPETHVHPQGPNLSAGTKDRYICLFPGCEAIFPRVSDLRQHGLKHISLVFSCPIPSCNISFSRKDHLFDHARQSHRKSPLSDFKRVSLRSKINALTTVTRIQNRPFIHDRIRGGLDVCTSDTVKSSPDRNPAYSENTCNTFPSTQSQLVTTDSVPLDPSPELDEIFIKQERSSQATDPDPTIIASKVEMGDQTESNSFSLWPAQYLALLDIGGMYYLQHTLDKRY